MTIHELITELEAMRPIAAAEKEWAAIRNFMMSALENLKAAEANALAAITKHKADSITKDAAIADLQTKLTAAEAAVAPAVAAATADMTPSADVQAVADSLNAAVV